MEIQSFVAQLKPIFDRLCENEWIKKHQPEDQAHYAACILQRGIYRDDYPCEIYLRDLSNFEALREQALDPENSMGAKQLVSKADPSQSLLFIKGWWIDVLSGAFFQNKQEAWDHIQEQFHIKCTQKSPHQQPNSPVENETSWPSSKDYKVSFDLNGKLQNSMGESLIRQARLDCQVLRDCLPNLKETTQNEYCPWQELLSSSLLLPSSNHPSHFEISRLTQLKLGQEHIPTEAFIETHVIPMKDCWKIYWSSGITIEGLGDVVSNISHDFTLHNRASLLNLVGNDACIDQPFSFKSSHPSSRIYPLNWDYWVDQNISFIHHHLLMQQTQPSSFSPKKRRL